MILLSFKAGLRAWEIAGLEWPMLLTATGRQGDHIHVAGTIAKNGTAGRIPPHPELAALLRLLHVASGRPRDGPVIQSEHGGRTTARSIVNWFASTYTALGYEASHSIPGDAPSSPGQRIYSCVAVNLRDIQEFVGTATSAPLGGISKVIASPSVT